MAFLRRYTSVCDRQNGSILISNLPHGSSSDLILLLLESPRANPHVVGMLRFMSDINQPSLPTPFYSILVSISVFMSLSTVFHSVNYPENCVFSLCSCGLSSALLVLSTLYFLRKSPSALIPQWGAADAEIKVPSGENTELKRSPFKARIWSVYSHTC